MISRFHTSINPAIPYDADGTSLDVNVMQAKLCLRLSLVIAELAFFSYLSEPRYWQSMGGTAYKYHPDTEERAWMQTFPRSALLDVEQENQAQKGTQPPS